MSSAEARWAPTATSVESSMTSADPAALLRDLLRLIDSQPFAPQAQMAIWLIKHRTARTHDPQSGDSRPQASVRRPIVPARLARARLSEEDASSNDHERRR